MNSKLFIKFLIIFLMLNVPLFSQYQDLNGWYSVGLGYEFEKKWEINFEEQIKCNSNSMKFDKIISDFDIQFKHKKWLSYSFGGRYVFNKTNENFWKQSSRLNFVLILKYEINRFQIISKTKTQIILDYKNRNDKVNSDDALFRQKVTIKYNIKKIKLTPYVSSELFVEDYRDDRKRPPFGFETNAVRFEIGTKYKINKKNELEIFYGFEKELNQVFNKRDFIFGINYKINLKSNTDKSDKLSLGK